MSWSKPYVYALLFWPKNCKHIQTLAVLLCQSGTGFEQEGNAEEFLCVRIEQIESGLLKKKCKDLIDNVIESLGFDVGSVNGKETPV